MQHRITLYYTWFRTTLLFLHQRTMSSTQEGKTSVDLNKYTSKKGEFLRPPSSFRDWISADGSTGFKAETGRYHLYVSYACPWAHRTLITRKLKGLEDVISVDVVDHYLGSDGWRFNPEVQDSTPDTVNGFKFLKQVYFLVNPNYDGRFSVPVLFDKREQKIVSNESADILRMLSSAFNEFCPTPEAKALDLYPPALREKIDELNEWIYKDINNGVYRSGFATTQEAYDKAVRELFVALDRVEEILSHHRYLTGSCITEADIRLYTTLVRFDLVYVGHFKCNKKRIVDYPNMWGYLRDLYNTPGFGETTNRFHIEQHYQASHIQINPKGIVAIGPDIDYSVPHDRARRFH